jgi:hypothetical protein
MFKSFPGAPCQFITSYQIGNIGLNAASPFLQPGFHVFTGHYIFQTAHNLIKDDIDDAFALRVFCIGL